VGALRLILPWLTVPVLWLLVEGLPGLWRSRHDLSFSRPKWTLRRHRFEVTTLLVDGRSGSSETRVRGRTVEQAFLVVLESFPPDPHEFVKLRMVAPLDWRPSGASLFTDPSPNDEAQTVIRSRG